MSTIFTRQDFNVDAYADDLAIADVNGDGKLDLVVTASSSTNEFLVLLGDGTGGFTTSTSLDLTNTGFDAGGATLADMDGDGDLDVIYASYNNPIVRVLYNDGTGGYLAGSQMYVYPGQKSMIAGDVNGDGITDAVSVSSNSSIMVFLGNRQGGFQSITTNTSLAAYNSNALTLADMNGDGKLDLVTSSSNHAVFVMLGDGTGGFTPESGYDLGWLDSPNLVTIADVNGDGKLDALTGNYNTVSVLLGDGTGHFTSSTTVSVERDPKSIAVADINGDGKLDLITANSFSSSVSVRWGDGNGGFSGGMDIGVGYQPETLKVADVNKDGKMDIIVTNFYGRSVTVLLGGEKTFATGISASTDQTGTLKIGDTITFTLSTELPVTVTGVPDLLLNNGGHAVYAGLDDDGRPTFVYTVADGDDDTSDLSVAGVDTTNGTVDGRAAELSFATPTYFYMRTSATSLSTVDVNGDGKLDILTASFFGSSVSVRLGDGAGGFSSPTHIAVGSSLRSAVVADVNGDGKLDILGADFNSSSVLVRLNDGSGGFLAATSVQVGYGPFSITVADVNGDGKLDILTPNYDYTISVRLGDGTGNFSGSTAVAIGTAVNICVADVNGDGKLDILAPNMETDTISVRLGDGTGGFSGSTEIAVGYDPYSVTTADMNGDGKLDIVAVNQTGATVSVRLGDGAGGFSGSTEIAVGADPLSVAIGDVNGDGKLDIVTASYSGKSVSVLLGDGTGGILSSREITSNSQISSVSLADVNSDGKLDILATRSDGYVAVFLNTSQKGSPFDGSTISTVDGAKTGRTVDATRPDAPTVVLTHDSGTSSTDGLTNNGSLTITGLEDGATLSYVVNDGEASATYDPSTFDDGHYTVKVFQTDTAGNVSLAGTVSFTYDLTIGSPEPYLANDTGSASNDFVTNDATLSIAGVEDGATLSYVIDGGPATATYDPTALSDGEHTIKMKQTDAAGNVSFFYGTITFTLDRSKPATPTLALTSDTGKSATDKITSNGALTITDKEAGATLSYIVDGATASTTYDPSALANGTHTVKVLQTDAAGNVSSAGSLTFTLDRSIATPVLTLTADTGKSTTDKITSNGALTISGKEAGATLSYIVDGGAASTTYNPGALANGTHTVQFIQTDTAGNVSTNSITFTLDKSVATPTLALTADTGKSATDKITSNGALTISGKEAGATLSYIVDGGTTSSTYNPSTLANGTHTVKVFQTDVAGNVSSAGSLTFTLDRAKPATPTLVLAADTGKSATDRITSNGALTIAGKETGTALSYIVDGGTASSTYNPSALANGTHTVKVVQTDVAGNVSSASSLTFTLDKVAPTVTGITTLGPGISGGSGTLTTGEAARFSIALSEAVTITDANKLVLTLSNGEKAIYDAAASTATKLVFSYRVGLEETSSDLAAKGIILNGATIRDTAGNNADLTGTIVNPTGTLVIDGYTGTSGADAFKGTSGANTFRGLGGNDSYVVNHSGDKVIEAEKQGTDTVFASVSHTLAANVENLTLTGSKAINGTGNSLANILTGNGLANILKGADGTDTLKGGAGDDSLYGGLGKDLMIGGSGQDTFVFDTKLGITNIDTIDDFSVKDDTIFLDDDIFTKVGKVGDLSAKAFYIGTGAHAETDRIIYDSKTGKLWYDADGSGKGAAIQFATLDAGLKMTATDFDIIG
ncbi:beta strand repeat-containing protein [Shinella sp. M31]|uniref:beta strand repeat-containing protein n=1 Tax=Shinella sp. M31 TaxID=3368615 RepID=UPI003B9EE617